MVIQFGNIEQRRKDPLSDMFYDTVTKANCDINSVIDQASISVVKKKHDAFIKQVPNKTRDNTSPTSINLPKEYRTNRIHQTPREDVTDRFKPRVHQGTPPPDQQQQIQQAILTYSSSRFSVSMTSMNDELLVSGGSLNDTIMEFYDMWLRHGLDKTLRDRVGMLSPFLYAQICQQSWNILHKSTRRNDHLISPGSAIISIPHCVMEYVSGISYDSHNS
uniref:Uncharacterized protein n=1 Tax=Glossina palpalis gambiensis TaxID=67801 RepID=A0A1B0BW57_9MUSC